VAPQRLKRFFTRDDRGYHVSRQLRATIAFSAHDLMADAPFSRLDFISCRNLLIYLRPEVQKKVLGLFHFALRAGGILFLGPSETVGDAGDWFGPIALKQRIYRHVAGCKPGEADIPSGRNDAARSLWPKAAARPAATTFAINESVAQRLLLESYAPASVLVNGKHQSLYYFGPIDRYLKTPAGVASLDLLASAREGLRPAIRAAIEKTKRLRGQAATIEGTVKRDGRHDAVTVTARAVKAGDDKLVLLSFADVPAGKRKPAAAIRPRASTARITKLEKELDVTRMDLELAIREREAADEELRAVNEEAMSVNEEFQTTNEELETSKEELQSLNEELTTLNSQLQVTAAEYQSIANDFENILNSANVATLFLDLKLNIRFFTPAAKNLFSVIASDIGRPLSDLARHFTDGNLFDDARKVLSDLVPLTREVVAGAGVWYTCLIVPYRTKENRIEGVVISFVDITERKRADDALRAAKAMAETASLGKSLSCCRKPRFAAAAADAQPPPGTTGQEDR
jgi:two-component system CheB/CheR fusion protein